MSFALQGALGSFSLVRRLQLQHASFMHFVLPMFLMASLQVQSSLRRSRQSSSVNPSVAAVNKIFVAMRAADSTATRADAADRFRAMSRREKAVLVEQAWRAEPAAPEEPLPESIPEQAHGKSEWSPSDGRWPVSPEVLLKAVGGPHVGLASWGQRARERRRRLGHMISKDAGLIAPGKRFLHRYSCCERHPGLCFTRDSEVYEDAKLLGRNFEAFCSSDRVGQFLLLRPGGWPQAAGRFS
jgi:hypothetical protein